MPQMRYSHLFGLVAASAMLISATGCDGPTDTGRLGPTSLQGPSAIPPNLAPIAVAGQDVTLECVSHAGSTVTLDGSRSSDSDGRVTLLEWFEAGRLIGTGAAPTVTL